MSAPKLSSRRLALLSGFALLGVLGAVSVCGAESPWRRPVLPPAPPPYRVTLEAPGGQQLPTFQHAGRRYVLGEPGERYDIRVYNPTAERVEAVVTVDGRDAVSGEVGDYVNQRGYLIEPWGSVVIEGFRRSLDEVAAFRFTDKSQSYSALRGTPENVGVIGVAVFPERRRPPAPVRRRLRTYSEDQRYDERRAPEPSAAAPQEEAAGRGKSASRAAPAPRSESSRQAEADEGLLEFRAPGKGAGPSNIGTRYGEERANSVVEVAFERRSKTHPSAVLTLRYDDYQGLTARGIDLSSLHPVYSDLREPDPFPQNRFAPPPP